MEGSVQNTDSEVVDLEGGDEEDGNIPEREKRRTQKGEVVIHSVIENIANNWDWLRVEVQGGVKDTHSFIQYIFIQCPLHLKHCG